MTLSAWHALPAERTLAFAVADAIIADEKRCDVLRILPVPYLSNDASIVDTPVLHGHIYLISSLFAVTTQESIEKGRGPIWQSMSAEMRQLRSTISPNRPVLHQPRQRKDPYRIHSSFLMRPDPDPTPRKHYQNGYQVI